MIQRIKVGPRMSQAVVQGDTVYLAGQAADDPSADVTGQTEQILSKSTRVFASRLAPASCRRPTTFSAP